MSLETQITALVSAANKLTSEVANKMKGIDSSLTAAQKKFEEFTGKDFPERVSGARQLNIYIDPLEGSDSNSGVASSAPIQTWARAREITGGTLTIYDRVVVLVRSGTTLVMDTVLNAREMLRITQYGAITAPGEPTKIYQGSRSHGRPVQPCNAPYVMFDQSGGDSDLEVHTAEFPSGHDWPEIAANNRDADWICYAGSLLSNASRFKLRNVKLKLHDLPFSTIYMSGSLGDFASYEVVLGASCEVTGEVPGAGSGQYVHNPRLLHVYFNPYVPVDIVANQLVVGGSLTSTADLFDNLDLKNVRSSFTIQ